VSHREVLVACTNQSALSTTKGVNNVPRPRLNASAPSLSAGQAAYVLERLIAERRISAAEVNRCVGDMHREISDLESRLQSLRANAGAAPSATTGARRGRPPGRPPGSGRGPGRPPGSGRKAAPVAAPPAAAGAPSAAPVKRRRRTKITAEQLASRQLQGRYLGLIRQIPASRRAAFQKIAKDRGREAAINEMRTTLKK
jgi:hypothetical protein